MSKMSSNPSDNPIENEFFSEEDRLSRLRSQSARAALTTCRRKRRLSHPSGYIEEPPPVPQDYPRRASEMLLGKGNLVSSVMRGEHIAVPDAETLRRDYFDMKSIHGVAALHGLERKTALKALKAIGVDVYEEIAREWESGVTIRELSRRHGPSQTTISNWIKKAGRVILPRNGNRKHDIELILQVYDETRSCKRASEVGGVAWETAKNILEKHDRWIESCKRPKEN